MSPITNEHLFTLVQTRSNTRVFAMAARAAHKHSVHLISTRTIAQATEAMEDPLDL